MIREHIWRASLLRPVLWIGFALAGMTGCGRESPTGPPARGPIGSVSLAPAKATIPVRGSVELTATVKDEAGGVVTGREVAWVSSDPGVAAVEPRGLKAVVMGVTAGQVEILARAEGQEGVATVVVTALPVASVTIGPDRVRIREGETVQLTEVLRDRDGELLTGRTVAWASSDPSVASVDSTGLLAGLDEGVVIVTARSEGQEGRALVVVIAAQLSFTTLSAGSEHTCGVTRDGTAYCWGDGQAGQLGNLVPEGCPRFACSTKPLPVAGHLIFSSVAAGRGFSFANHTCGIAPGGIGYCWGSNNGGQLGIGSGRSFAGEPVAVGGGLTFTRISAGSEHTCGVTAGGQAYCWGRNDEGQLGDGSTTQRSSPGPVSGGLTFVVVSAGSQHTCGLTPGGEVYCWGRNDEGQLGDGSTTDRSTPVLVAGELTFTAVSAGGFHTCGLTEGGTAYCWGWNERSQLGDGAQSNSPVPVPVSGGLRFISLSGGGVHTCGIEAGGDVHCWGSGALGDGTTGGSAVPVRVGGGLTFTELGAGTAHTCGLATDGLLYCWGENFKGQVGDGSRVTATVPVPVADQT